MKSATSKGLDGLDFSRFDKLEFKSAFDEGLLFMPDMRVAVVKHKCPYCQKCLYKMRDKPLARCKNKKCIYLFKNKKSFIISKTRLV